MKKRILLLLTILTLLCAPAFAAPETKATSVLLATSNGIQILYEKDADTRVAPADLTRLMTAYAAYSAFGMDEVLTMPENITQLTDYTEPTMNLKGGEQLSVQQLITGLLMRNANDAAWALALHYGGETEFIALMNETAAGLGMTNSNFVNFTGDNHDDQYTTAADMLLLYRAVYQEEALRAVTELKSAVIPATNVSAERTFWSRNGLISRYYYATDTTYAPVLGGMFSSSSYGGESVLAHGTRYEKQLLCIILHSTSDGSTNYAFEDARSMLDYGFNAFTNTTLAEQDEPLYEAQLKNGQGNDYLILNANSTLKALIADSDDLSAVEKSVSIQEPVAAPVKKGDVLGTVTYFYQDRPVGTVDLVADSDVSRDILKTIVSGILWFFNLKFIKAILWLLLLAVVVLILLIILAVHRMNQKKRRRNRRNSRRVTKIRSIR